MEVKDPFPICFATCEVLRSAPRLALAQYTRHGKQEENSHAALRILAGRNHCFPLETIKNISENSLRSVHPLRLNSFAKTKTYSVIEVPRIRTQLWVRHLLNFLITTLHLGRFAFFVFFLISFLFLFLSFLGEGGDPRRGRQGRG